MQVKVVFFGAVADSAGRRNLDLELPGPSTVSDAIDELSSTLVNFRGAKLLHAVNEEYVDSEVELRAGDTLAIFTAVSGG